MSTHSTIALTYVKMTRTAGILLLLLAPLLLVAAQDLEVEDSLDSKGRCPKYIMIFTRFLKSFYWENGLEQ